MSFAAVVALVSTYEGLRLRDADGGGPGRRGWFGAALLFLGGILTTTLVASLAVAPFGIYHFHNTQAFAMLANLLAIPICNFVVMPAALAALVAMPFGLEAAPLRLMGLGIDAMVWCAHAVSESCPAPWDVCPRSRLWPSLSSSSAGCGAPYGARAGASWAWCRSRWA
jgi:competence protein ComEC